MKPSLKYILRHNLLLFVLFTALGTLLHVLVHTYGRYEIGREIVPASSLAYAVTILMVNAWGFGLLFLHGKFANSPYLFYTKKRRLLIRYYVVAVLVLLVNYLSFVFVRWLFDRQEPFILSFGGGVLLYAVWFIEMTVVNLIFIEYITRSAIDLYREQQQLRKSVEIAQYRAMQNQLDPHFLFNSLSVLISEISFNPENAVKFTQNLSEIYRYVLRQQHKMEVTLQEEMGFFDAYVFLFRTRLDDCIRLHVDLPPEALSARVPPLTFQLLLENIFKHNYMSEKAPMDIRVETVEKGSRLRMSNTLRPCRTRAVSGRGLKNLAMRMRILCGRSIEIDTTNNLFTVTIPLLYE